MAFQPTDITPITTYGATRTTTFTATIAGSSKQEVFTNIVFQSPPITEPVQYRAVRSPVDSVSEYYSSSLTVLGVTEVVAIIQNTNGTPISTGTLNQTLSTPKTTQSSATALLMIPDCSSLACWPSGQRIGTIIAIIFFIIGAMGLLWWGFCHKPRQRTREWDLESGRADSRTRHIGARRGSRERNTGSRQSSRQRTPTSTYDETSSASSRQHPIQSYVRARSRSRSRAIAGSQRAADGATSRMKHSLPEPTAPTNTLVKDFALPAAAGLATVAGLAAAAGVRRPITSGPRRSSVHDGDTSRGRRFSGETRDRVEDRQKSNSHRGRPRARR
jgi:hypothetical protein